MQIPLATAALLAFRSRQGHFPECGHRFIRSRPDGSWVSHRPGWECPVDFPCGGADCTMPGDGQGCSKRCAAANRALGFLHGSQMELGLAS